MMDQFMEHQRRTQASFTRWEQERWRQERESMERWRQEAREHERQLFGMFCTAMAKCNAAITAVLKAKTTPGLGASTVAAVQNSMPPSVTVSKIQRKTGGVTLKRLPQDAGVEVVAKRARDDQEEEIDDDEVAVGGEEEEAGDLEDEISTMVQVEMDEGDATEWADQWAHPKHPLYQPWRHQMAFLSIRCGYCPFQRKFMERVHKLAITGFFLT